VFRGLTAWLGLFSLLFIWLQLQQVITGVYAASISVERVTMATITHPVYIIMAVLIAIVLAYVFAQALDERIFSLNRSLAVAFLALYATLTEKILFVVEGLQYPSFALYHAVPGSYFPSTIEMLSIAGTIALAVLFFLVIVKVIPVVELHAVEDHDDHDDHTEEVTS